jgi:pimeloyl-ACP methyl ester carboxylesterase
MLVLLGRDDVVFPPDTVAARTRSVLRDRADLTVHVLPGTSHGMTVRQSSEGQPFRWVISEPFLELLADWVAGRGAPVRNDSLSRPFQEDASPGAPL